MPIATDYLELGQFIPLHYHYNMLNDVERLAGFKAAIEHVVQPGSEVLELGGGTGVLSYFAANRGANVRCVEMNPEMIAAARCILSHNGFSDRVEVIRADATHYLPPEPVDVVICEMLHTGLLREKQLPVIQSFKKRYLAKFGGPLPTFIPEACIQGIQPVQQDFDFMGYVAPVISFQQPTLEHERTVALAEPNVFQRFFYGTEFPTDVTCDDAVSIAVRGEVNALRMISKHVLAIVEQENRTIDWHTQHIVMPLPEPISVGSGDKVAVRFGYDAGAPLHALQGSLDVYNCSKFGASKRSRISAA